MDFDLRVVEEKRIGYTPYRGFTEELSELTVPPPVQSSWSIRDNTMLAAPAVLTLPECLLLKEHLPEQAGNTIERFNASVRKLCEVVANPVLSVLTHSDKLDESIKSLKDVRSELSRSRYAVGFIGLTNAGKSTTINNVLGQIVCKPGGAADPTSSQPSRLLSSDRESLDVEYLTEKKFEARKQSLCAAIGLSTPGSNEELIEQLNKPEKLQQESGIERPRLKEDVAFLKEFLASRASNRSILASPPKIEIGLPYESRYDYTAHGGGSGSKGLLVREARFHICNDRLPRLLELCDLPGLDSKRSIDDIVTEEYLPDLQGAFLFVNVAMAIGGAGLVSTLRMVTQSFRGSISRRVWLVFTKMDSLARTHFQKQGGNIFSTITDLLEKTGISADQVCFCSNKLAEGRTENASVSLEEQMAMSARMLCQTPEQPFPEVCPQNLRSAWEELLSDGGIERIRRLMNQDVAKTLSSEIQSDAIRRLVDFDDQLERAVEAERARQEGGAELLEHVNLCLQTVLDLSNRLGRRLSGFDLLLQLGEQLRGSLNGMFERPEQIQVLNQISHDQLASQHKLHTKLLNNQIKTEMAEKIVGITFRYVSERLSALPRVPIGPGRQGCHALWDEFSRKDITDPSWHSAQADFESSEFAAWLEALSNGNFDGTLYRELMLEKIRSTIYRSVQTCRVRLRIRLRELEKQLHLLTTEPSRLPD